MPTSADLVQIAICEESVYGVTPTNPVFQIARITGEGLSFAPTSTVSNEMNPRRQVTDSILTGGQSTGDLNFELAYEKWFDDMLAGALANIWTQGADTDMNEIGAELKSFTIEKKIPVPGGTTQYHRFTGCIVNTFSINIRPNQPITGTFGILGKALEPSDNAVAGATYVDPVLTPVMTAPLVVDIAIGGVPAVAECFNNLTLSLNNNNRAIECIGTLGPREVVLGRAEITAEFSVLFNSNDLIELLVNQAPTSLEFGTTDSSTQGSPDRPYKYTWFMPRVKFTANPVVAGGTNQDVVNAVSAQGLLDPDEETSLRVTRTHRA